jgi:hypothetical protein
LCILMCQARVVQIIPFPSEGCYLRHQVQTQAENLPKSQICFSDPQVQHPKWLWWQPRKITWPARFNIFTGSGKVTTASSLYQLLISLEPCRPVIITLPSHFSQKEVT